MLTLIILIYSTIGMATSLFDCKANLQTDNRPIPLSLKKESTTFSLISKDNVRKIEVHPIKEGVRLDYKNISSDKVNHLSYSVECTFQGMNCRSKYTSEISGKNSERNLKPWGGTRSTKFLDEEVEIFEISRIKNGLNLKLLQIEWDTQFFPINVECVYE